MEKTIEALIDAFLRRYDEPFSIDDLKEVFKNFGMKFRLSDLEAFINNEPLVYRLSNSEYITRAGIFSNRYFSIKPSKYEVSHKLLIIGDRCMPFIDTEMLPHEIVFKLDDSIITTRIETLPRSEVIKHYSLYGEEYSPQYISFDPANREHDFSDTDYELPPEIRLTVLDIGEIYERNHFKYGDRFLAKVIDWDAGVVKLEPLCKKRENPFAPDRIDDARMKWYKVFEKAVLDSFKIHGPCESIEAQLAWIIGDNVESLCIEGCGSIEEYLEKAKKVSLSIYGVETRLWRSGEDVQLIGEWTKNSSDIKEESQIQTQNLFSGMSLPITDIIINAYLYDSLFRKDKGIYEVYKRIIPEDFQVEQRLSVLIMLQLAQKRDKIRINYNWFADFEIGAIRKNALQLYSKLINLVSKFGFSELDLPTETQQPFVVLSQLFLHATRLVESIQIDNVFTEKELNAITLSLEGMEYSYQDIEGDILAIIEEQKKNGFSVINRIGDENG